MQQNLQFNARMATSVSSETRSPPQDMLDVPEELRRDDLVARRPFSLKDSIYLLSGVHALPIRGQLCEVLKRRPRADTLQPNQKVR